MRDLLDEIMEMETNLTNISQTLQRKSCDATCQCKKCKDKRQSLTEYSHSRGCGCQQCQQSEMSDLEYEGESWLDSITDWGTNVVNSLSGNIQYSVTPGEEYGRTWKNTPAPGLPTWVRKTSANGAALPHVEAQARATGLGETFVKTVIHMARTESQGRFALPANNFNNNPPNLRPPGKGLITAWGVFQFNRDAWTCLFPESERKGRRAYMPNGTAGCSGCKNLGGCAYPWDCTAMEEIALPMKRYVELFQEVKQAGGSNEDAAAGLRLWHVSPVNWYRKWLENARRQGFENAWNLLPSEALLRTGNFLDGAGVARPYLGEFDFEDELFGGMFGGWSGSSNNISIEDRTAFSPKSKRIRERDIRSVYALVLHQMGFSRGNTPSNYDKVTAHFAIMPDGKISQLHPLTSYLYASNGFNKGSVAVEFAGNLPSTRGKCYKPEKFGCNSLTQAQVISGRKLVQHLIQTIGITHILGHIQSSGSRTNDPGPDIWKQVGQWAIENYKLNDGGSGFKIGSGKPIPDEWRNWSG